MKATKVTHMTLKIKYDSQLEFMEITHADRIVFFGDYSDFKNDPIYLHAFLSQLGLDTTLEKIYL